MVAMVDELKIPAQALAEISPNKMEPGTLFLFRGSWALRVFHAAGLQAFLMLEGERAGSVFEVYEDMAEEVAIIRPFGWFPMTSMPVEPAPQADWPLTMLLTESGPAILGKYEERGGRVSNLAFNPKGECIPAANLHRATRLARWSIGLCYADRPFQSLGTVLQIDRLS